MIQFSDWHIQLDGALLARQYDNLSAALIVAGDIPDGWVWDMLVKAKGNLNIIRLSEMEDGVGAILTDEMLAISGYYTMQLRGTQGETVKHTNKIQVFVPDSLSGNVQWPTIPSEFSQLEARVNADADRAEDAASHQPYPNPDTGTWWTWDAETGAYTDTGEPYSGGGSGEAGQDGGYYAPSVDDDGNLTWTPSKADMPPVEGANIKGPAGADGKDGAQGPRGATGATPNLQIGEVTTLDAGSDATASITGTAENPLLNLGIPKGADGGGGGGSGEDIPVTAEKAYAASVLELNHIATNQYVAQHNSVLFEASENTTLKVGSSNLIGNPYSAAINASLGETVEYSEITDGYALDYNSDYAGVKNFTNQRFGFSANIVSGKTYTLRFYVDSSSVGNVYAYLTNDPTTLGNLIGSGNIRNGTTCQITFTADADYLYIRIPIQNLPASITKITLAEGTVPLEYGSGAASYTVNAGDKIWLDGVKGLNCVGTGSFYESPLAVVSFNGIATGDGTINSCATAKTWVNMGDSIWTFGASTGGIGNITDYMAALCGGKWHNIATGGTTMASRPGSYAGDYDALDFWQLADAIVEGDFTAAKAAAADLTSNLANVDNIDWSSVDYITVAYGTNDLAFGAEIDNAENLFDTATICGALRYGIKAINTQYPNIRFIVLGLIYRNADSVPVAKIVECNQALNAAADYVGAEYVAGYGINEGNRETFLYDGTHPNGAGKQRIAETLARRIHDVTYLGGEG